MLPTGNVHRKNVRLCEVYTECLCSCVCQCACCRYKCDGGGTKRLLLHSAFVIAIFYCGNCYAVMWQAEFIHLHNKPEMPSANLIDESISFYLICCHFLLVVSRSRIGCLFCERWQSLIEISLLERQVQQLWWFRIWSLLLICRTIRLAYYCATCDCHKETFAKKKKYANLIEINKLWISGKKSW